MSDGFHYPQINERDIGLITRIFEANPTYFEHPDCPYNETTKEIFKGIAKYQDFDTEPSAHVPDSDNLISQVNQLVKELKIYGQQLQTDDSTNSSDRNTYFRLSVTLVEKLIDIKEKIANIKQYETFTAEILDIMDKILTPDQRKEVMDRLERLVGETGGNVSEAKQDTAGAKENETTSGSD